MSLVAQAAALVAFPVMAGAAGATVAVWKVPGPRLISGIQHFAAGVVVAALAGELLPDLRHEGNLGWAVAGFATGVALVLALAAYSRRLDQGQGSRRPQTTAERPDLIPVSQGVPVGFLAAVAIDLVIDGVLIGLGVRLGSTQGVILTIALTLEILFLSLSLAAELVDRGLPRRRSALICVGLTLCTALGAVGAAAALGGVGPAVLAFMLAFGAAALLYLAVEELLVEAHEQTETTLLSAMFFAGFLTIYILGELGP
ncbi:ZIP family metal transporter [Cumulibacter manganitolerans]|uniref:ZIP family metal transporter n=1 Tax=Cumulibacter manganitolerans TaxID=1884992 RepID=UPI0012980226|nr:ZIP family metal transporter [Cumulibacter manganitolerans]